MTYNELRSYFQLFHEGEIDKRSIGIAIHMWQRASGFDVKPLPTLYFDKRLCYNAFVIDHNLQEGFYGNN